MAPRESATVAPTSPQRARRARRGSIVGELTGAPKKVHWWGLGQSGTSHRLSAAAVADGRVEWRGGPCAGSLEYEFHTEVSFMTTAGQVAVVLIMLALIAGGSLIAWVVLFHFAAKAEDTQPPAAGSSSHLGDHV